MAKSINIGKPKAIPSPQRFLDLFFEFRAWHFEQKVIVPQLAKNGHVIYVPHIPPLTWEAFDAWLFEVKGIIKGTDQYRGNQDVRYTDYMDVVRAIHKIMYTQKFSGAAVGAYQHNIIARELGLVDKKETTRIDKQPEDYFDFISRILDEESKEDNKG